MKQRNNEPEPFIFRLIPRLTIAGVLAIGTAACGEQSSARPADDTAASTQADHPPSPDNLSFNEIYSPNKSADIGVQRGRYHGLFKVSCTGHELTIQDLDKHTAPEPSPDVRICQDSAITPDDQASLQALLTPSNLLG